MWICSELPDEMWDTTGTSKAGMNMHIIRCHWMLNNLFTSQTHSLQSWVWRFRVSFLLQLCVYFVISFFFVFLRHTEIHKGKNAILFLPIRERPLKTRLSSGFMMGEPLHNSKAFLWRQICPCSFQALIIFSNNCSFSNTQSYAMKHNCARPIPQTVSAWISPSLWLQGLNSFPLGGMTTHPNWAKPGPALPCPAQPDPALPNTGLNTPVWLSAIFHIHHHLALCIVAAGNKKLDSGNGRQPVNAWICVAWGVDKEKAGMEVRS